VIQHVSEIMLFLNYCIFSGSAEALGRCGGKVQHLLIAYFLSNTCAKHYENPRMLSRVTAKNVRNVFWDTVYSTYVCGWLQWIVCRQEQGFIWNVWLNKVIKN